jgi:hypothetical protein
MKSPFRAAVRLCYICIWPLFAQTLSAQITQIGISPEGPIMRAEVSHADFAQTYRRQEMPNWCWAASISNIFAFYGHTVTQKDIVYAATGKKADSTASPAMIAAQVNRPWADADGEKFEAHLAAAYDVFAHVLAINNRYIVNELSHGRPLLVCNTHHCMVITAVDFTPLSVRAVWVFDPLPSAEPFHQLPYEEAKRMDLGGQLTFVGALTVEDEN